MGSFSDSVRAHVKKTSEKLDLIPRKIALEAFRRIVLRTPVGNVRNWIKPRAGYVGGRLRGNWQIGIGSAPSGELDRVDGSGSQTIAEGTSKIGSWKPSDKDEPILIVNNLPYAEAVENGHSKQAPSGMLAITVAEFDGIVQEAVR